MRLSKRIIAICTFIVGVCVVLFTPYAFSEDAVATLSLQSSNLDYNIGTVNAETVVKSTVFITNKLDEAIEIKETRSVCECLAIKVEPQRVERNGIFQVDVTFDAVGFRPGENVEEVAYILTKNSIYEIIRFAVQVNIAK